MKNDDTLYNYCKRNEGVVKVKSSLYVIVRIIALCYN